VPIRKPSKFVGIRPDSFSFATPLEGIRVRGARLPCGTAAMVRGPQSTLPLQAVCGPRPPVASATWKRRPQPYGKIRMVSVDVRVQRPDVGRGFLPAPQGAAPSLLKAVRISPSSRLRRPSSRPDSEMRGNPYAIEGMSPSNNSLGSIRSLRGTANDEYLTGPARDLLVVLGGRNFNLDGTRVAARAVRSVLF